MKYKIKDPKQESFLKSLFKDEKQYEAHLNACCESQWHSVFSYIILNCFARFSSTGDNFQVEIKKDKIQEIQEYEPNNWNPYPKVQPPINTVYLVTLQNKYTKKSVITTEVFYEGKWDCDYNNLEIIAFRAMPQPYEPKEE